MASKQFEEWLKEAHALRSTLFADEGAFYLHLLAGESLVAAENLGVTYDQLLEDECLGDIVKWRRFKQACASPACQPVEKVKRIGYEAFCQLSMRTTPERAANFEAEVEAFIVEKHHPPSPQYAKELAHQGDPPPPQITRRLENQRELVQLRAECARLRKEKVALESRVKQLELQISKMRGGPRDTPPTS